MKVQLPPPFALSSISFDLLRKHSTLRVLEQDGRYLHWDELRHRPVPDELTHEEWWQLVKLARFGSRTLPLRDGNDEPFHVAMTDTILRQVHEVDRDASGRIELPEDVTNRANRDRYVVSSLIEEAFRSSQLEGASTTRAAANDMIRSQRAPRTTSERMILNNFHAMEWVGKHKDVQLTTDLVFELHALVTQDTLETADGAGRFRKPQEAVKVIDPLDGEVSHVPPDARLLPARMAEMCAFANAATSAEPFIHPVVRAILLHFWLAYDHPFVDGNGRTARALFYWSMLKQGYWLVEFISISGAIKKSRTQYDRAFLYAETDDNDATYFVLNQLKMLRQAVDELFASLKRNAEQIRQIEHALRDRDDLNHRQLALLSYVLRHGDAQITVESHQTSHRVVYETARTDLLGLVQRGFFEQRKVGKKLTFSPVRQLHKRLGTAR
jgi:Fic family protein